MRGGTRGGWHPGHRTVEAPNARWQCKALVPGPRLPLKGFKQECPMATLTFEKAQSVRAWRAESRRRCRLAEPGIHALGGRSQ